jgi:hypothetical protein
MPVFSTTGREPVCASGINKPRRYCRWQPRAIANHGISLAILKGVLAAKVGRFLLGCGGWILRDGQKQ